MYIYIYVCVCVCVCESRVKIPLDNFFQFRLNKIQGLMYLLSNGFGHIHTSHVSRVAEMLWEMILLYSRTIIQMVFPYFTDSPLVVNHPCGRPQTSFIKLSPDWPPQHTKLGNLWLGLNINLCHSRAIADPQAHSRVFCGEFGTDLAKYFKPEGFYYCKPAGLWWPIFSRIQIDLTEFHQGKVIQEISLFLHLCVAEWVCWLALVMGHWW